MKQETRYSYEKRIEELRAEVERLRPYRLVAVNIYDTVVEQVGKGDGISKAWILARFRQDGVFK